MEFDLDGIRVFAATGGRTFNRPPTGGATPKASTSKEKAIVFLHGAGMDRTVWGSQARHFAALGWAVLAPDFPGHGRSAGAPLASIAALADWTIRALDALQIANAVLVGHSMGARVALEAAARLGGRAGGLALVGIAERLAVNLELRRAAEAGEYRAVNMILKWGFAERVPAAGAAPRRHARRLLERALGSALGTDLAACADDRDAVAAAAKVTCPAVVIWGADDRMTPGASAARLAARIAGAVTVEIRRCGHMSMLEEPAAVTAAIARVA